MSGDPKPVVSIGMPVCNCGSTVSSAIRSILSQDFRDWELLLADDGSSDKTPEIIRSYSDPRIRVIIDDKRMGLATRLNQAIRLSRGTYFARMDGDDICYPQRLDAQISYLRDHPGIDLVGAWVMVIDAMGLARGKREVPEAHDSICAKAFSGFPMVHPTYMGEAAWFQKYYYDESFRRSQDQDLLLRSYRFSRFANVPRLLLGYRELALNLRRILVTRRYLARSLFRNLCRQGECNLAVRGAVGQVLKGSVDCFAVITGLNYRVLRHRAHPATGEETDEWRMIWRKMNVNSS